MADDGNLILASAAASAPTLAPAPASGGICSQDCILAFSLASSGMVLAAVLLSVFVVHRRRRRARTESALASKEEEVRSRAPSEKFIEDGGFQRYLSPTTRRGGPAVSHRLDEDEEDDEDDLVDVLDLFDPPAAAHLRSPGPRRLVHAGLPAIMTTGTTPLRKSSVGDRVGIHTMLASSPSAKAAVVSAYTARAPVLVPRNLDAQQRPVSPMPVSPRPELRQGEARPKSMMREKRPPPLKLQTSNANGLKRASLSNNRTSYISVGHANTTAQAVAKPPLSPITPLLTPTAGQYPRSPGVSGIMPRMRVPGTQGVRRLTVTRGENDMPQELIRRSIDAAW